MKTKNILFFALAVATLVTFSLVVSSVAPYTVTPFSPTPFRAFVINLPEQVDVQPGQMITVNGSILNIGLYWEHNFNLTASGLTSDFNVSIEPNFWENLMTIRAWDPVNGVYKVPVPFNITISVPQDATGAYAVNITGQEHQSWKMITNSSVFILRVGGNATAITPVSTAGIISVTNIIVPESVKEFVPFNVSFNLVNSGGENQTVNVSLTAPADWTITAPQSLEVPAKGLVPVVFSAIPTSTAGNLAIVLNYPYEATVINVTQAGPYLVPVTNETAPSGFSTTALVSFVQQNTVLTIIIAVVVLILIWYFASTYQFYTKRKKPEEMKKQIELPAATVKKTIETSSQDEAIETQ